MVKTYNEESIQVIKGLDQVRKRPVLYLGERGNHMVWRMIKEAVDNCTDEHLAGRNNYIEVVVNSKTNTFTISDKAEGIPVGIHATEKISTLEVVLTQLHAGGKFNANTYKHAAGTHGIGIAATNALSTVLKVWTYRDSVCYFQEYSKGVPKDSVKKCRIDKSVSSILYNTTKRGTVIQFTPDQAVVSKDDTPAKLDRKHFLTWVRDVALLNKGLSIVVKYDDKTYKFLNKIGPELILRNIEKTLCVERIGKTFILNTENCTCAFAFSTLVDGDGIRSYVCNSPTKNHGTHYKGLVNTLCKVLLTHSIKKDKFNNKDLLGSIICIINWRMSEPEFTSQVKDELDSNVTKEVEEVLFKPISDFFTKNKKLARSIIKNAVSVTSSKEQYKQVLRSIGEVKKASKRSLLPNVLSAAVRCKPDKRELFLVEGDSSAGTAKKARDSNYQEVMKLKGKPLNSMRASIEKVLSHEAFQNLIIALGVDTESAKKGSSVFSSEGLRVRNVYLLADSDPDGFHINLLIAAFFYRFLPDMIKEGRLRVVDAPLFFGFYKNKRFIGSTFQDCFKQMPKGAPKHSVIRAKGWGEVSYEALSEVAFNPATRSYITLTYPETKALLARYVSIVSKDTESRKELLGIENL